MKSLRSKWQDTTILPVFLFQLCIIIFVFLPLTHASTIIKYLSTIILASNTILGLYATNSSKKVKYFGIFLAFCALILQLIDNDYFSNKVVQLFAVFIWICLLSLLLMVFINKTFSSIDNDFHKIQGGIACYLIIGLLFTYIHVFIHLIHPDAYVFNNQLIEKNHPIFQIAYFSFTTLTTTGYGDVTPLVPLSQTFTLFEQTIGVLFPAIFIGYLISAATSQKS